MYPKFKNKHEKDSHFKPSDYISYQVNVHKKDYSTIPKNIILTYSANLFDELEKRRGNCLDVFGGKLIMISQEVGVFGRFGIGAPAATVSAEAFFAVGTKKIISLGFAGALQKTQKTGDIILCNKAIRDEGVSYHYQKPGKYSYPDRNLSNAIGKQLRMKGIQYYKGSTWTIDAPYRETKEEIVAYQSEGVLTVEMEAAALFAVSQAKSRELASAFVVSDSVALEKWEPQFHTDRASSRLLELLDQCIHVLSQ